MRVTAHAGTDAFSAALTRWYALVTSAADSLTSLFDFNVQEMPYEKQTW